jgi:tRNA pseudouridine32 synthase/23S rRNA pseudouridine746 synthase
LGRADLIAETGGWIAVDKPAGLPTVPAPTADESLWRILEDERGERLWVVHRIDRGTSGLVIFARDADTHRRLSMAFERGDVSKMYLAFVHGTPPKGTIDTPLHTARRGRMRPARPGEPGSLAARTDVRVLQTWKDASLVEVRPKTGRRHQIRVHLKSVGAPLLVDPVYGGEPAGCASGLPPERPTLHAHRLVLDDTDLTSPLPPDLTGLRSCLERS